MPVSLERVLILLRWMVIGLALATQLYVASGAATPGTIEAVARALQLASIAAIYNSLFLVMRYYLVERQYRIALAVLDALVITVLNGLAGGIYSPFVFLLYLIIVEAALLFTPSGVLSYTAVVAIFYATTTMLLPGRKWDELNITILLSVVLGMFIWASVCGAVNRAFEQERALVRREQELRAELNRQVVALSALNRLSERLNASLDIDELLQNTVKELPDALAVDACVAFLANCDEYGAWRLGSVWCGVDEDFEPLDNEIEDDETEHWVKTGPLALRRTDFEAVLSRGAVLRLLGNEVSSPESSHPGMALVVPLSPDEGHGGGLALVRQEGLPFTQSDQEILAALGRQLSLLIKNARLYEQERLNVARLQELEQMKSDFLSTVSHEFRTPLTSIKASTILMLSQSAETAPSETETRLLRNIDRNTERLSALVTDLLDMAKLQNGRLKLSMQPVSLSEIATDVVATMRPLTDGKGQSLELEIGSGLRLAYADRRRVEQVLNNLLSNAHRYTPKGSQIKLAIVENKTELVISISDNGPGLKLPEQERVFERFYRGPSSKGGTGLGLAIARSLVELHGGRIWVESNPNSGTTFYFTLQPAPSLPLVLPNPTARQRV